MVTLSFQITSQAYELLMQIKRETAVEYRDTNYETLEDFKQNSEEAKYEYRTEEWFLKRNNNGTLYLIYELERCGLVECDGESWHMTYILTEFGKEVTDEILKCYGESISLNLKANPEKDTLIAKRQLNMLDDY